MVSKSLWRWSVFLLIIALYSCTKHNKDTPSNPSAVVTVDEAKMAFAEMLTKGVQLKDSLAPNAAYNIPDWASAQWKKQSGGIAFLEVPLRSTRKISRMHRFLNVQTGSEDLVTLPDPWLMVYKDSSKQLNFSVVQQIPRKSMSDSTAPSSQQGRFSGEMKVYNWSGNFLYGTQYTNGIRSKKLSPGGRRSNNPNARWEYACYTKYICVFSAQCTRYQSNQGFEVVQVSASVETTDGGGCTNSYPGTDPYTELVTGNPAWNMYNCGSWTFYNSSSEQACDSYWVDDDLPGPDPDPNDPNLPSLLYYIYVDPPPPGKVVNITDFLKCFNQTQGAKFTLYSDQPVPNQRIPADVGSVSVDVGHTFVTIEQTVGGTTIKRTFGFYPSVAVDLMTPGTPKVIIDDANHPYDVALSANISATQLANIIYIATHAPAIYNLFSYNCTNYGIQMANAAGMALPFTQNPSFPGCNPGDLGQDMRLKTGVVTTPGLAPAKTGTCP